MKNSEILRKVQEKLSDPKRWCKEFYCIQDVKQYCLLGAEYEVMGNPWGPLHANLEVPAFNDAPDTTHLDIMTFLDFAILAAKDEEAL